MKNTDVKIIQFEPRYRDDLIFMILEAKNAIGRVPGLNEDLLDIEKHYFAKGDMFWIAVGENDRVIGSVGYNSIPDSSEIWLHRLFVKANLKHQGIGTKLLQVADERSLRREEIRRIARAKAEQGDYISDRI